MTAILNVTSEVEMVRTKVYDEESLQEVDEAVGRVRIVWECNMGETRKEKEA